MCLRLMLTLKGIISAQSAGIGNVTGGATYQYDMVKSVADLWHREENHMA